MLSGNKLKHAYAFSMAVGPGLCLKIGFLNIWWIMDYISCGQRWCIFKSWINVSRRSKTWKYFFFFFIGFCWFLSLENDVGFLVQYPKLVCLHNIAQNVLRDAGWRSQMRPKQFPPPHPSCTYLNHNRPHHTIPRRLVIPTRYAETKLVTMSMSSF